MRVTNYFKLLRALTTKNLPIYTHFGLTHRCNLHCRMCTTWQSGNKETEVALKGLEEIAYILSSLGVINLSLGGGEPFLREDLPEVISLFRKKGLRVRVLTNGVAPDEAAIKRVVNAGLREVSVSLDTLNPEKQEYICNTKGGWRKIIENLSRFSRYLPPRGNLLIMNVVVSHLNIGELPRLAEFAHSIGYHISFVPVRVTGAESMKDPFAAYAPEFKITSEDYPIVEDSYHTLISMKQKGIRILNSTLFLKNSENFLKTGKVPWECDAGKLYFSITPEGGFAICHNFKPEGLYTAPHFIDHLRSEEFRHRREKLKETCPGCMRPCWAEITHIMRSGKSLREMTRLQMLTWKKRKVLKYEETLKKIT